MSEPGRWRELEVLPEMIESLPSLTLDGQRHVMTKVMSCLKRNLPLDEPGRDELIQNLAWEAERRVPDIYTFCERTLALCTAQRHQEQPGH